MLLDQIKKDQIAAMKAAEPLRLSVLRMLVSAINYKQIDAKAEMTDEEVMAVIAAEAKKRRESIESYTVANRPDQAEQERQELAILATYLPVQLTEEEIKQAIDKLELPADFGEAMRIVSPQFKGRADGGTVARLVKEKLGNG